MIKFYLKIIKKWSKSLRIERLSVRNALVTKHAKCLSTRRVRKVPAHKEEGDTT